MGDIKRRVWVSAATRQIVSSRLQLLLLFASVGLGFSLFLEFIGGIMWLLMAVAQRATQQQLATMRLISYCFFGCGGLGLVACGCVWLVFVRLARNEMLEQELRHAPQQFKFPNESASTSAAAAAAAAAVPQTVASSSIADVHFVPGVQLQLNQAQQNHTYQQQQQHRQLRPLSVRALSSCSLTSPPPSTIMSSTTIFSSLSRPISQRVMPLERPRFVSQSESLTLGSLPRSGSRPSSIATNSSKEQLIV